MAYLDDILILGKTLDLAKSAVSTTKQLFEKLGFIIHPDKSKLTPSTTMDYLGFTIDSVHMSVTLPKGKAADLTDACNNIIVISEPSIRQVARVIDRIVTAFPGTQFGHLHTKIYKGQRCKHSVNTGHFDRPMKLPTKAISQLQWWRQNIRHCSSPIIGNPSALQSAHGWGATNSISSCGGRWDAHEAFLLQTLGINYLEMLGAFYGLKAYCSEMHHLHVRLQIDNTTVVAYINHMGGIKSISCDNLANAI